MRKLSILAFMGLIILGAIYYDLRSKSYPRSITKKERRELNQQTAFQEESKTLLSSKRLRELNQIGAVINENNVVLDEETRNEINNAKKVYNNKETLKELQALLEQGYLDRNTSLKDIKRLQNEIIEEKNKLKDSVFNTEKWDPRFVYYLMIQENYTYAEVNLIKSLAENGLNAEEIDYINELIREEAFLERIMALKSQADTSRGLASSSRKKSNEKDDYIDDPLNDGVAIESKLIEMNYNQDEKEEMIYGNNQ